MAWEGMHRELIIGEKSMPWTEKQTIPYGAIERVWVPGWTEAELIPYGGQQRVYEDRPRHYILPHESQEFGSRDQIERLR